MKAAQHRRNRIAVVGDRASLLEVLLSRSEKRMPAVPAGASKQAARRILALGPCWVWRGGTDGRYGRLRWGGKRVKAHVMAYFAKTGRNLRTRVLGHVCHCKLCCNPDHVRPVTESTNLRETYQSGARPRAFGAVNAVDPARNPALSPVVVPVAGSVPVHPDHLDGL